MNIERICSYMLKVFGGNYLKGKARLQDRINIHVTDN